MALTDVPDLDVDVPAIDQIGLVVRDLEDGMDRFGAMLGIDEWAVYDFEPPALERTTYRGEETPQRWQLCIATLGDVDVELIEPIEGENSYTEHLDEHGEGLHHVACFAFDDPRAVVDSYTDAGVEILQSGVYNGSGFWYMDLREEMNGVIFEVVDASGEGSEPDRTYEP